MTCDLRPPKARRCSAGSPPRPTWCARTSARDDGEVAPRPRGPRPPAGLRAHQRLRPVRALLAPTRPGPPGHRLRRAPPPDRRPRPAAGAPRGHRVGLPDRGLRRLRGGGRPLRTGRRPPRSRGRVGAGDRRPPLRGGAAHLGVDRSPATTASASSASARATGSATRPPSTTTPRPTASTCASWPAPTPTSTGCARPWTALSWPPTPASPPWPNGRPGRRDQRHRRRLDGVAPGRRRRAALHRRTTCRWAPPTAPPTSSPTRTWPSGVTWWPWTTRSSARSASRRHSPASSASHRWSPPGPPASGSTTMRSGAHWSG